MTRRDLQVIGWRVADLYREESGGDPEQIEQREDGEKFKVNAYPDTFLEKIDQEINARLAF